MGDVLFNTKNFSFDSLEKKYRNFFAPTFEILVDGKNLLREGMAIPSITVDTSSEPQADTCRFSVNNAYDAIKREFQWIDKYLVLGKYIEVKMGYVDKLETVFYGLITSLDFDYPAEDTPSIAVTAMDVSFLMMKGNGSKSWLNKKYSDVAKELGKKRCSKVIVDDSKQQIGTIDKNKMDDFHFLQQIAEMINYEFFVVGKTMYFRKPLTSAKPVTTLTYGKNLISYSTDMNLSDQVSEVIVRGWNPKEQKVIEAKGKTVNKLGSNSKTGKAIMASLGSFEEYVYTNVESAAEAQAQADGLLNERAMKLVTGSGECIGIPEIRAGRHIKIEGVGKKLNQPYFLTSVTHTINSSGYLTSFEVEGNAV